MFTPIRWNMDDTVVSIYDYFPSTVTTELIARFCFASIYQNICFRLAPYSILTITDPCYIEFSFETFETSLPNILKQLLFLIYA